MHVRMHCLDVRTAVCYYLTYILFLSVCSIEEIL